MLQAHSGTELTVSYVGQDGYIMNMQFRNLHAQSNEIYAFFAHGSVWLYEIDMDSRLAINVRKADDGHEVNRILLPHSHFDGDRVIVSHWPHWRFISVLELGKSCEPITYQYDISKRTGGGWAWYEGTLHWIYYDLPSDATCGPYIVIPEVIRHMGVEHRTIIFGIIRSGICLIGIGKTIIAGWCIMRNAVIWTYDCKDAGDGVSDATYVSDNIIQYMLRHDYNKYRDANRTWHYYNVTDGTSYDVV